MSRLYQLFYFIYSPNSSYHQWRSHSSWWKLERNEWLWGQERTGCEEKVKILLTFHRFPFLNSWLLRFLNSFFKQYFIFIYDPTHFFTLLYLIPLVLPIVSLLYPLCHLARYSSPFVSFIFFLLFLIMLPDHHIETVQQQPILISRTRVTKKKEVILWQTSSRSIKKTTKINSGNIEMKECKWWLRDEMKWDEMRGREGERRERSKGQVYHNKKKLSGKIIKCKGTERS